MMEQFDVSTVVRGVDRPDEIEYLLGQFGCRPRLLQHRDVTVFVSSERAFSPNCAMASFMRKLECLRVRFDYITVGDAWEALAGYEAALAGLDGLVRQAA
jgi:hypothetical protein